MLSSHSDRRIIKIYVVGLVSLVLLAYVLAQIFYQTLYCEILRLKEQQKTLLHEQSQYGAVKNQAGDKQLLATKEFYQSAELLKPKLIMWLQQAHVQLVDLRFDSTVTITVVGSFAQDMSLLIELANAHLLFDVNAVDLISVKNGIELRLSLTNPPSP